MPRPCMCAAQGGRCLRAIEGITRTALGLVCGCGCHACTCTLATVCERHLLDELDDCCDFHTVGGSSVLPCLTAAQLLELPEAPEAAWLYRSLRRFVAWRASL